MKKILLIFIVFVAINLYADNKVKAIWATVWSLDSKQKINSLISDCKKLKINTIYAQVRYRGDAMYVPNKNNDDFYNPEPKCYLLKNKSFDPLEYLLQKTKGEIKVHAWVTTFVVTTNLLSNINSKHIYFSKPNWIAKDENKLEMQLNTYEGLYFDPCIKQVRDYTINVFCDIVKNYDVAGLHFDYARFPSKNFGANNLKFDDVNSSDVMLYKQSAINSFVQKLYSQLKSIKKNIIVSAAVKPSYILAKNTYGQNWLKWVKSNWIDYIVTMSYSPNYDTFFNNLLQLNLFHINSKIVIGLRAWKDKSNYNFLSLKKHMVTSKKFLGISFFSYSGLKKSKWLKKLNVKENYFESRPNFK